MANLTPLPVSLRLPPDLLAQVDEWASAAEKKMGIPVSRTAAIMALIRRGLDVGVDVGPDGRKKARR